MFVPFIIFASAIVISGPLHNEKGFDAINTKGLKPAAETAWEGRKPYDATSLKGAVGNYGND